MTKTDNLPSGYSSVYSTFDSPLMEKIRAEAYGEDIGQHSWVTASELQEYGKLLKLSSADRVLDVGCGPGGPLVYLSRNCGCSGMGVDISDEAVESARLRAQRAGVSDRLEFRQMDCNRLALSETLFDHIVALDSLLHLTDRREVLAALKGNLKPGGILLYTDAGVITGEITDEERARRSAHGVTVFSQLGENEEILAECGYTLVDVHDTTASVSANAAGRLRARTTHREELIGIEGEEGFQKRQRYLETVVDLSGRAALSRFTYVATRPD